MQILLLTNHRVTVYLR